MSLEDAFEKAKKAGNRTPEHLTGDPDLSRTSALGFMFRIIRRTAGFVLLAIITAPLWPLYWLGALIWGSPPNVPKLWQVRRYLRLTWTIRPPSPGLSFGRRCFLTIAILNKVALAPVFGIAWFLDELFFGRVLGSTTIVAPLIEISAARSGSTQFARYLEDDQRLATPNLLQIFFPYIWLWKLIPLPSEELCRKMPSVAGWSDSFHRNFWNGMRAIRFGRTRLI